MEKRVSTRLTAAAGRKFGLTVGTAFLVIGAVVLWRDKPNAAAVLGGLGGLLALAGLVVPTYLGPFERGWMALAHLMSRVTTPIFMGGVYMLVVAPVGWVRRTFVADSLAHAPSDDSYWKPRVGPARRSGSLTRQF